MYTFQETLSEAPGQPAPRSHERLVVRAISFAELQPADYVAWKQLEQRCRDGNPFMSCEFVTSAVKWLRPETEPLLIVISRGDQWLGCGLFSEVSGSRRLPLPHLVSWSTSLSFLDGLLLDSNEAEPAAEAFWNFLTSGQHGWHGVEFPRMALDSRTAMILEQQAAVKAISLSKGLTRSRAALIPALAGADTLVASVSLARARSLRKGLKELKKRGEVSYRLVGLDQDASAGQILDSAEAFLALEDSGWKNAQKSSLLQLPGGGEFFRSLVRGLADQKQVFFSEMLLDERLIGSVAHLVSGDQAFAFKLGWDQNYDRGCPGFQMKANLVVEAPEKLGQFSLVDSCSTWGSFIEHVWPHRRPIASCTFATTLSARIALKVAGGVRWVKQRFCKPSKPC